MELMADVQVYLAILLKASAVGYDYTVPVCSPTLRV